MIVIATLVAGCGSHRGDFALTNNAEEPIAQALVKVCNQTIELHDIAPGGRGEGAYIVTCDGQYDIEVQFSSLRKLRKHTGEIARGVDFRHEIVVTQERIDVREMH